MLTDYFAIGSTEAWNSLRLRAYLENVGSPFTSGSQICGCETLTRRMLDPDAEAAPATYDTPATDPAPWFDPDFAASGQFLGFLPLTVSGLDDNPRARTVTNAVGGGGVFGPVRDLPRTLTVTGLLVGTSCCGVEYGLHWLREVLAGCGPNACEGDCVSLYDCCPDAPMTQAAFNAAHRRTFRRTALVSGPTVTGRTGNGRCAAGTCAINGDIVQVEFVLTAASPWPWTDPAELLDVALPIGGTGDCVEWCTRGSGDEHDCAAADCLFASCTAAADACADPLHPVPSPPSPTSPEASFCTPLVTERDCYDIDLTMRPQWACDVPVVTLTAGLSELRNIRVTVFEKQTGTTATCDEIADRDRCGPVFEAFITYVPPGGAVTIDGQTGRAVIECGGECRTASSVFGDQDGGPLRIRDMCCALYCVCIESDANYPPSADARFTFAVSGRGL